MTPATATVYVRHPVVGEHKVTVSSDDVKGWLADISPGDIIQSALNVIARRLGGATFSGTDLMGSPLFDSPPEIWRSGFEIDASELKALIAGLSQ